jgi:eukaryotic-like serine/threonine-protein kinase
MRDESRIHSENTLIEGPSERLVVSSVTPTRSPKGARRGPETMDLDRERAFLDVLRRALDVAPAERRRFIEQACEEEPDLGAAVLEALSHTGTLGSFLEGPGAGVLDALAVEGHLASGAEEPELPSEMGRYTLVELIGRGGMGSVYRALQHEPVEREVAVKLLRSRLPGRVWSRLQAEAQLLARLDHNHIARLYDAGTTETGLAYLAMELLDGEPITGYCDSRRLSIEERLRLLLDICSAIQHAHQKRVLHRDIKPSNVVVVEQDGRPLAKVIDFGIAELLDDAVEKTPATGVLGTPSYMSPESLGNGEEPPDTRSDVYSLGVLLSELVAGPHATGIAIGPATRPLSPSRCLGLLDAPDRRQRARERAIEPARLVRLLRRDLDWVVAKATAPERSLRYGSMVELADDLRRTLAHQPTSAHPPGVAYRCRKFVRRHIGPLAAVAVATLALAFGILGLASGRAKARLEAQRAKQSLAESQEMSRFVNGLFEVSDPGRARGESVTARELLDRGVDEIQDRFADQPKLRARFLHTLADIYTKLGLYDTAADLLTQGLALLEPLGSPGEEMAAIAHARGVLHFQKLEFVQAESWFRRALELREPAFAPETADPDTAEKFALTLHNLGAAVFRQRRLEEAELLFRKALRIREQFLEPDHPHIARSVNALGALLLDAGDLAGAEPYFERTLRLREESLGADHPSVALALFNLGLVRSRLGRYDAALEGYSRALAIQEKALGPVHAAIGRTLSVMGTTLGRLGRFDEAEDYFLRSLAMRRAATGDRSIDTARALSGLAGLYHRLGRLDEAEAAATEALGILEQNYGHDHYEAASPAANLGLVRWDQGRLEEAEGLLRRALAIREAHLQPGHVALGRTLYGLAGVLHDEGRQSEAARFYARAEALPERLADDDYLAARLDHSFDGTMDPSEP